jgi:hypothetical protein
MRLKSLIAAVALGTGLAGTGLTTAEATTAPKPTASPGRHLPGHPGDRPSRPGEPPIAARPGRAIPKAPNYTG